MYIPLVRSPLFLCSYYAILHEMKRIVQISDLHIPSGNELVHGIDPRSSFLSVLQAVKHISPVDRIIITGDIAHGKLTPSICSWVTQQLQGISASVHAVPGNHDSTEVLASGFGLPGSVSQGEACSSYLDDGGYRFIFLDTSDHSISDSQLNWVRDVLSDCIYGKIQPVICMHHPPCPSGSVFMDASYPFTRSEAFGEILQIYHDVIPVLCGHYHTGREVLWNNAAVYITPSTCFEIDPYAPEFTLAPVQPGFRVIDLTDTGLETSVFRSTYWGTA